MAALPQIRKILAKNLNRFEYIRQSAVEWFVRLTDGLKADEWGGRETELAADLVQEIMEHIDSDVAGKVLRTAEQLRIDLLGEGLPGYSIPNDRIEYIRKSLEIEADAWLKRFQLRIGKMSGSQSVALLTDDFEASKLMLKANKDYRERVVCRGVPKYYGALFLNLCKALKSGLTVLETTTKNEVLNA